MNDHGATIGARAGTLIDNLRMLNRKERFFLIGQALGRSDFRLSDDFRHALNDVFGLEIPEDAFVAMDYHVNWLYAALVLTYCPREGNVYPNPPTDEDDGNDKRIVQNNQEDVDLLLAWEEPEGAHVVMIEAKGATSFTTKQLRSKATRLAGVFCTNGQRWKLNGVQPHFALMSPRKPNAKLQDIPAVCRCRDWMLREDGTFHWIRLTGMDQDQVRLKAVVLCDATGTQWTLKSG